MLHVHRGLGRIGYVIAAVLLAIWAVLDAITWGPGAPAALLMIEFVPLTGAALVVAALMLLTEELRISPDRITRGWRLPWGRSFRTVSVSAKNVTDVLIARKGPRVFRRKTVQMVVDADILHFGGALNRAAKLWVRDCIVAVISK